MSAANPQPRQSYYKNRHNTNEHLRKKRQESNVQLRKGKREEQMLKRRNITMEDLNTSPLKEMNFQDVGGVMMKFEDIIVGIVDNSDPQKQFDCTQSARKILSRERHPPIGKMVEAGIVCKLVEFLSWDHNSLMQFEAAWALTNIASGTNEQTLAVVHAGAVPSLIKLLSNANKNVVEQAMWALGNIAGDGASMRDYVLEKGIVKPLVALTTDQAGGSFLQNLTWTISNLCRNKNPHTSLPYIVQLLPTIVKLVNVDDTQVKTDVCWALSYITDGPNDRIELVLNTGVLETLVRLLSTESEGMLLTPVLRVIGNVVTGTDLQTQRVIDLGALVAFKKLLINDKATIQKEAAWTISNITAGTQSQIQAVIDADIVPILIHLLTNGDFKTQKEACWAVTNFTSGASLEQMVFLAQNRVIEGLCKMLTIKDPKILQVCMDGLSNMLVTAKKLGQLNAMCCVVEACGGVDALEDLQKHDNETVYNMSLHIIDNFFNDEDDDIENVAPETTEDGDYFQFNQSKSKAPDGGFHL
ncbi:importin subunit alpha-1-like [Clavelina lepadiformis]|uniref:importin subunit alpha-1-like n=1 Tax=Clavelina lepadiformis TaxID=159417 RepID=UPI00404100E6